MRKLLVSLFAVILALISLPGTVFSAASIQITEVPDIKIIIDGALTSYTDIPINIDGKNLLPLRELLENLGVQNDDEHIKYDPKDKSVTINKDDTSIQLAAGNKTAYVNGSPVELEVAPVFYVKDSDGKVYIPLAFVSEALGKKVVWDDFSRMVLICDEIKYNSIKEILMKSNGAAKEVNKYKMATFMDCSSSIGQISMGIKTDTDTKADLQQKKMLSETCTDMYGAKVKTDTYYADNASYEQDPMSQEWQKTTYIPAEYDMIFASEGNEIVLESNELFCAGLNQVKSKNPDEILLKGDVYLPDFLRGFLEGLLSAQNSNLKSENVYFSAFNLKISLDTKTYLVNSVLMKAKFILDNENGPIETDIIYKKICSDYNGDIQIDVPEEVLKNAVESEKETI